MKRNQFKKKHFKITEHSFPIAFCRGSSDKRDKIQGMINQGKIKGVSAMPTF